MEGSDLKSWSELYRQRRVIQRDYPRVWDIPLVKKEMEKLRPYLRDDVRILEVGAGDRRFEPLIRRICPTAVYRSLDVDLMLEHDYRSLDEVRDVFDFVFMFEVIEHLTPEEALAMLRKIHGILAEGGEVLVGTPNLYHPTRYFTTIDHKTPFSYEDLGGILRIAGFNRVRLHRMYNDAFLRRIFRLWIGVHLHKYLGIDFAPTIFAEGVKVPGGKEENADRIL